MNSASIRDCLTRLKRGRSGPGWGYRMEGPPYVEPSVLTGFVMRTWYGDAKAESESARSVADWLASIQQPNGALGPAADLDQPGWPTAWALWFWQAGSATTNKCHKSIEWLLQRRGDTFSNPQGKVGHDTTIPGWPWVQGTHSWVEPTAVAVQALATSGLANHERTRDGVRMLLDRAVPRGGWNVGNRITRGTELRAQCAPTGLVLVSLATALTTRQRGEQHVRRIVDDALGFLLDKLPETRAPQSLGWGLLGLAAWSVRPEKADEWLAQAAAKALRRGVGPLQLSLLLLAARSRQSLETMRVRTQPSSSIFPAGVSS